MTNRGATKYNEAFAALALVKTALIQEPFSIEWLQDRPDSQHHPDLRIGDFGIEVTAALLPSEGGLEYILNKLCSIKSFEDARDWFCKEKRGGKKFFVVPGEKEVEEDELSEEELREETRFTFHGYVKAGDGLVPFSVAVTRYPNELRRPGAKDFMVIEGGGYNEDAVLKIVIDSIKKKIEKFENYENKEEYTERGLFIVRDDMMAARHLPSIDSIQAVTNDSTFDVVFFHVPGRIIVIRKDREPVECTFTNRAEGETKCEAMRVIGYADYDIYRKRFYDCYGSYPTEFSGFTPRPEPDHLS